MMAVLHWIYVVAAVVALFGAAIFVHEFGHYWVARRRGLKVEAFAIGFGPKIVGWVKDGIDYSWRWIPAGGYVKLPQMLTSTALEGEAAENAEKLPPVTPLSKILVAFAGPFMNVVFAIAVASLLYVTGLPIPVNPPVIGYVEPGSMEAQQGIQAGDRVISVDGKNVDSWDDVQRLAIIARTNVLAVAISRTDAATHKATTNVYQLATTNNEAIHAKVLNLDPQDHPVITLLKSGQPADKAGLKEGDVVMSFGNTPVYGQDHLVTLIQSVSNRPTEIVVERGTNKLSMTVTPAIDPSSKKGRIGVGLRNSFKYQVQHPGPLPWVNIGRVLEQTYETFGALLHSKQTGVGPGDLTGPIGILFVLASKVDTDYRLALDFLVLLNINLAMINLLPFPVLDGGHILMSLIEWIRRRPVNVKVVEYATTVFAVLLISLMLYVSFGDVKRLSLFRSLFGQDVQIEQSVNTPAPSDTAPAKP